MVSSCSNLSEPAACSDFQSNLQKSIFWGKISNWIVNSRGQVLFLDFRESNVFLCYVLSTFLNEIGLNRTGETDATYDFYYYHRCCKIVGFFVVLSEKQNLIWPTHIFTNDMNFSQLCDINHICGESIVGVF